MFKQIRKIPRYLLKLMRCGSAKEVLHTIKAVKLEHLMIALAARLDRKSTGVKFRNGSNVVEINNYLNLIPHRREKIEDDIYRWDFGSKQMCCNYTQLLGLQGEYLEGLFDEIYKYDCKGKKIVDIGGFVGDSALYFLSKGASRVVIYEPVLKNLKSLSYNLKGYENRIECYREALAAKNEPLTLASDQPEGSSSFGAEEGNYRLECMGITITSLLEKHQPIDAIKVDCEGGEVHLLNMSDEEIRSVPFWMVETHTKELHRSITDAFTAGFIHDLAVKTAGIGLGWICSARPAARQLRL